MPFACRIRSYSSTCQSCDSIWVVSGLKPRSSDSMNSRETAGQSASGSAARWADHVPVAPENFARKSDASTCAAMRSRRHAKTASSLPIVVGVAGCPCVRDSIAASRCATDRALSAAMTERSFGSQTSSTDALHREGVGGRVDVLARAREVRELGDAVEAELREPVAHEVLDGLDVVPGDRLALGEPGDLVLPEVEEEHPQAILVGLAERLRAEQRSIGEGDEPLHLDLDAGAVEARLREVVAEGRDGGAIPAVEGAEWLDAEGRRGGHGTPVATRRVPPCAVSRRGGSRVLAAGRAPGSRSRSYRAPRRTFPGPRSTGRARRGCGRSGRTT